MVVATSGNERSPDLMLQRGIDFFEQHDYARAVEVLEVVQAANPRDAKAALWLARAYGRLAEQSGWFIALQYARQTHKYLELAVDLNPTSREALLDLQQFYEQAPGFLGGSNEKAEKIKQRISLLKEP